MTSSEGVKIEAEILSVDGESVTIRKTSNPRIFKVPFTRLSQIDKEYFQGAVDYFSQPIEVSETFPKKGATIIVPVTGQVTVSDPASPDSKSSSEPPRSKRPAKANEVLLPGSQIRTGEKSEAILIFGSGATATMGANTNVLIEAFIQKGFKGSDKKVGELLEEVSPSRVKLELDFGELVMDVKKLNKSSSMLISLPLGVAGVRGTQFMVTANKDGSAISVLTGSVDFLDAGKVTLPIGRETRLEATKPAPPKRRAITAVGRARIKTAIQVVGQKTANLTLADLAKSFVLVNRDGSPDQDGDGFSLNQEIAAGTSDVNAQSYPGSVFIPDKVLAAALLKTLNKPKGPISRADLASIGRFSSISSGISDIAPLAHCAKLTELDLRSNQIKDVTPLSKLTNLSTLRLAGNPIPEPQKEMLRKALPKCDIKFD